MLCIISVNSDIRIRLLLHVHINAWNKLLVSFSANNSKETLSNHVQYTNLK
jgi:hypothetical protein